MFAFLRQPGLDATNCCAELAIRFGVILRKVWGGSTWADACAQSVLMSTMADLLAAESFGPGFSPVNSSFSVHQLPESSPARTLQSGCSPHEYSALWLIS